MLINYKNADGQFIELEVSDDVGAFYLESIEAEKKNNRKNSRNDRHTSFIKVEDFLFKDANGHSVLVYNQPDQPKRSFNRETDFEMQLVEDDRVAQIMSCLNDRQKYLITKCVLEGWKYTELASLEGVDESAIRHAVNRAKAKLKKFLE